MFCECDIIVTIMRNDKWIRRWVVPASKADKFWTVAVDADGNYGCSCPVWKFRRIECKHIREIKGDVNREKTSFLIPDELFKL
jgi:hypothetical protein